jgi:hypothetical protein
MQVAIRGLEKMVLKARTGMKYLILVTLTAAVLSGSAIAREHGDGQNADLRDAGAATASSDRQQTGAFKTAIGGGGGVGVPAILSQEPPASAEPMTRSPPRHRHRKSAQK